MISLKVYLKQRNFLTGKMEAKMGLCGLSTDEKPIKEFEKIHILNGSTFFEMDTGTVYFYDEENHTWLNL